MKNIILLFITAFSFMALSQECQTTFIDNSLYLSGWDVSRTDYSHARFESVTGLDMEAEFNYSGPKDQAEFGYPWFYYNADGSNYIHFAGIIERSSLEYQGKNQLHSLVLNPTTSNLDINGVKVGDSISKVYDKFSVYCEDAQPRSVHIRYNEQALRFYYQELGKIITKIEFFTPM